MSIARKVYSKLPNRVKKVIKKVVKKEKTIMTKEQFCKKLLKYDVISFDIFDTLITRKIFSPEDINKFVESKLVGIDLEAPFEEMRRKSEQHANEVKQHDVNIDEIYFSMMDLYGYTEDEINGIKGLEVDLEIEFTVPRKDMLDVLEFLMKHNKKVVLTSDMYLNRHIIERMLKKCGYQEGVHYRKIYLSNDKNLRKDSGTMWNYLRLLYKGVKFIHIGDNMESDYNIPISYGMKAMHIDNPRDQLNKHELRNFLDYAINNRSISDSLYLGYVINVEIFNSPFANDINDLSLLSRVHTAPMIYELLRHIDTNSKADEKLLFLAREGYNLQKLYKTYCEVFDKKEKDNYYFLASRKATISALINDEEDIVKSLNKDYSGSIKTLLKSVYDVDYKGWDTSIKLPEDLDKIKKDVLKYSEQIISRSNEYKEAYLTYINNTLPDTKNLVIVDLGYSGTIQYNLSKMLNKDLKGLYLTNSDSVKKYSKNSKLLFAYDIKDSKDYLRIYNYSLILEYFLSAPHGQLQYFEKHGNKSEPVYNDEVMDAKKKKNNEIIYDAVISYFNYVKELEKDGFESSKQAVFEIYRGIVETNLINRSLKDRFGFVDSFNDSTEKNVFKIIDKY